LKSLFFWLFLSLVLVQWNHMVPQGCVGILIWYSRYLRFVGSRRHLCCIILGSLNICIINIGPWPWILGILPPYFSFSSHFVHFT
jgi:hypothetical protein